ncbi:hypothetical protein MAR621_01702 [Maribacter dokdonensis]|nr:hypothetical protein MAR621_01702 [Maribacter dokdonensis]
MKIYINNNYMKFSLCNYRQNECVDDKMVRAVEFVSINPAFIEFQFIVANQQEDYEI